MCDYNIQNHLLILYKFAGLYFTNSYFVKYKNAIFGVEKFTESNLKMLKFIF